MDAHFEGPETFGYKLPPRELSTPPQDERPDRANTARGAVPNPASVAAVFGVGLEASVASVQSQRPDPLCLTVQMAGATMAWTLVDARHHLEQPTVLISGVVRARPRTTYRDREREIARVLADLFPLLDALASETSEERVLAVAYRGPGGAMARLGPRLTNHPGIVFLDPTSSDDTKAGVTAGFEHSSRALESCGATHLVVATDGSVRRARRGAGAAWVASTGQFGIRVVDTASIVVAEVSAIADALSAMPPWAKQVQVLADSREAIRIVGRVLGWGEIGDLSAIPVKLHGAARAIAEAAKQTRVTVSWVKGHAGHDLNETADRLAVLTRRGHHAGLSEAQVRATARGIVEDAFSASDGTDVSDDLPAAA